MPRIWTLSRFLLRLRAPAQPIVPTAIRMMLRSCPVLRV